MKIIIDSDIPFIDNLLEPYFTVLYAKGTEITNNLIKDADALIIRTRTKCNSSLLEGTSVKFIATATIGTDHIDLEYCKNRGIRVANAAGCNAGGVMQYVFTALYSLALKKGFKLPDFSPGRNQENLKGVIGVIGDGNVGSRVAAMAEYLGFEVLRCDPVKEREQTLNFNAGKLRLSEFKDYYSLDYLLENSDIVTMHTWLDDITRGMANEEFFNKMKSGAVFINASRGEVVNEAALLGSIYKLGAVVIDVWNGEPNISLELLNAADIATPHIAGYSFEGKVNGTEMSVRAVGDFFGIEPLKTFETSKNGYEPKIVDFAGLNYKEISEKLTGIFPIFEDDFNLRQNLQSFEILRSNYNYRREFYVNPTTKTTDC
ncbi:MAG: 4-phosphoerythronate dehydrogenase [Bacteroidales bacterium]|nr:4-phosphoerythronate dehydrogenase [Bacteroidales bacterium]